jgi:hypothetical protein
LLILLLFDLRAFTTVRHPTSLFQPTLIHHVIEGSGVWQAQTALTL